MAVPGQPAQLREYSDEDEEGIVNVAYVSSTYLEVNLQRIFKSLTSRITCSEAVESNRTWNLTRGMVLICHML